jgi:hypothetical protein
MPGSTTLRAGPPLPAATWTDFEVVEEYRLASGDRGIRARRDIPAGQVIGVYGGEAVAYKRGPDGMITDPTAAARAIQLAADDQLVYAVAVPAGVPLRGIDLINHDCHDPTVTVINQTVLATKRDVCAGEPLVADYTRWDLVPYGERCWCPQPRCLI